MSTVDKSTETEGGCVATWACEGTGLGGGGVMMKASRACSERDGNVLELMLVMVTQLWEYTKIH